MSATDQTVKDLKQTLEQTRGERKENGRDEESWSQKKELESRIFSYLVEEVGCTEEHAEKQASEIVLDSVMGDLEEAKKKIEAIGAFESYNSSEFEDVKQSVVHFYNIQRDYSRSSDTYQQSKKELHQAAADYFEPIVGEEYSDLQASRITTEVSLGEAHVYDTLAKLDAVENLRKEFES